MSLLPTVAVSLVLLGVPQERELVTQHHSLGGLELLYEPGKATFDLLPRPLLPAQLDAAESSSVSRVSADAIIDLLRATCLGDKPSEEIELLDAGDGTLEVTAPKLVQERIAARLAGLRAACRGDQQLEVRVLVSRGGGELPEAPLFMAVADAERRLAELVAAGKAEVRRAGSTALLEGGFGTLQQGDSSRFVGGFTVQICHGSVVHDPVELTETLGLAASVRAVRVDGGTWLDLAVRDLEAAAPHRVVDLKPRVWAISSWPHELEGQEEADVFRLRAAIVDGVVPLRIECPQTRFLGVASSFALPDGQSLWLPCMTAAKSATAGVRGSVVLELHVTGAAKPARPATPVEATKSGVGSRGFAASDLAADSFGTKDRADEDDKDSSAWPSTISARPLALDQLGLSPPSASIDAMELSGRILRGADPIATFRMPLTAGLPATITSGIAGSFHAGWGVDVADQACLADPEVSALLDGFWLRCVAERLSADRVQLAIDGVVRTLDAPPRRTELLNPFTPDFEAVAGSVLPLHETRLVAPDHGVALARFGGEPLALELSLRLSEQRPSPVGATCRSFVLGGLARPLGERAPQLDLAPPRSWMSRDRGAPEVEPLFEPEVIRDLVRDNLAPWNVGEGVEVLVERDGDDASLDVTAPAPISAAVFARVADLLALLERSFLGGEQIEVRVIAADETFKVTLDSPLVLAVDEAEQKVAELVRSGKGRVIRSASAQLTDGLVVALSQSSEASHATDFEVEIAHGVAIADPVVETVSSGFEARIRASRSSGATWLDFALRDAEPHGPPRELIVRPKFHFASPLPLRTPGSTADPASERGPAQFDEELPMRFELPTARRIGFAGSFRLEDGKALWIPCCMTTLSGTSAVALVVRVVGPFRPACESIALPGKPGIEAAIVRAGAVRSFGFSGDGMTAESLPIDYVFPEAWPSVVTADSDCWLPKSIDPILLDMKSRDSVSIESLPGGALFIEASKQQRAELIDRVTAAAPAPASYEIRGKLTNGDATIAEFRVPATADTMTTIWSGDQSRFLAGWDVDVAGEAMCGNPEMGVCFDGFALGFTVTEVGEGRVALQTTGIVTLRDGPIETVVLGNPLTPAHENLRARRLFVRETRGLTLTGGGNVTRFGGAPIALEVTVQRR